MGGDSDRTVGDVLREGDFNDDDDDRGEIEAVVLDYLESQGGSASAADVLKATRAAGLNDNSVKKARKKIGVKTQREGFGPGAKWVWTIETGIGFTPEKAPSEEVSSPIGVRIDSIDSHSQYRESMTPMAESMATAPAPKVSEDVIDSQNHDREPSESTGKSSAVDAEVESIVIGSLHHEFAMALKTVEQSAPPRYRDQVPAVIEKLLTSGRVIQDEKGRYLLAAERKPAA